MNQLKRIISWVNYQLLANALLACLLVAGAVFVLTSTFVSSTSIAVFAGFLGFVVSAFFTKLYQSKRNEAILYVHKTVGDTEYSLNLLDKPQLNIAEQLQLERLNERVQHAQIPTVISSKLGFYALFLMASIGVKFGYPLLKSSSRPLPALSEILVQKTNNQVITPQFQTATLQITPPAYTNQPEKITSDLNASAVSGSLLKWQLKFSQQTNLSVRLANSRGEELVFKQAGDAFEYSDRLSNSGLYAFKAYWHDSLVYQSDYYRLDAIADLTPKIEPTSKELFQYHLLKDPKTIQISAKISDDFLVKQAYIVATLARGSGENVKFREVKFPLNQANFKQATLSKSIDLKALNFTPGDELYYYWAALDNKQPEANFSKSDTYFLVYKDTTNAEEADLATMAVNILPEYFRSQRQIIMDSEKLIAKKKKITEKEFKSTSNELGFDQKALRLRYGQYLGEEFENSIGGGGGALPTDKDGDVVVGYAMLKGFVHAHDQGEPGGESGGASHAGHDHSHGEAKKTDDKDPVASILEEYVHSHDDAETNTFYEQSTRSLLKMALEQMWQSELHLRLYEPEKALPFEHKALEYLKSAQQRARTFVKKTSFDPPPIKEKEKRMTGELKKVNENRSIERRFEEQQLEKLVAAVMGYLDNTTQSLSPLQRQNVLLLGNYLSDKVINSGLPNWSVLSHLQKLVSGKTLSSQEKRQLQTKLYSLVGTSLPDPNSTENRSYTSDQKLEKAFWRNMNNGK